MADAIISWAEAHARGLKRYFTGKACKRGHIAERLASNGMCFECANLKNRASRAKDPEKYRERYRKWRSENPDIAKAATLVWRNANPDKVLEMGRRNYKNHRTERLAQQAQYSAKIVARVKVWAQANPERTKRYRADWVQRNPEQAKAIGHACRARRRNAEGRFTADDIKRIFKAQRGKCAYCRTSLKGGYDIDHIIPIAEGGTNWPSNLQLCCDSCNSRKHARDPIEFAQSTGRLI